MWLLLYHPTCSHIRTFVQSSNALPPSPASLTQPICVGTYLGIFLNNSLSEIQFTCHTNHYVKVNNSVVLRTLTQVCHHHRCLVPEQSISPEGSPVPRRRHSHPLPSPWPHSPTFCVWTRLLWTRHGYGVTPCSLCVWRVTEHHVLRIHPRVVHGRVLLLYVAVRCSVCGWARVCACSCPCGHLGCSHLLADVNCAALNTGLQISVCVSAVFLFFFINAIYEVPLTHHPIHP